MDTSHSGITTPQRPEGLRPRRTQTVCRVTARLTGRTTVLHPRYRSRPRLLSRPRFLSRHPEEPSGSTAGGFALREGSPSAPTGLRADRTGRSSDHPGLQVRQTAGKARVTARARRVAGPQRRWMGLRSRPAGEIGGSEGFLGQRVSAGHGRNRTLEKAAGSRPLRAGVRAVSRRRQRSHGFPKAGASALAEEKARPVVRG
jgi:hypothetical protein